jgi:RNA polymerase sigma-70 factor (ECF subfamily)
MIVGTSSKVSEESKIGADDENRVSNDRRLIAEALSDPEVFARLYRRHYDAVFRYCVHRLFERQTAEDVTSAVFLKVVENLHRFKGTERQFRNWLYKIATNAVNSHLRKTTRRAGLLKIAGERANNQLADCESATEKADEQVAILRKAMLDLRPRYQTIITLRFFENLKLTEIAEVLGSSDGTVRSQLARALAKLRKKMGTFQREVSEND